MGSAWQRNTNTERFSSRRASAPFPLAFRLPDLRFKPVHLPAASSHDAAYCLRGPATSHLTFPFLKNQFRSAVWRNSNRTRIPAAGEYTRLPVSHILCGLHTHTHTHTEKKTSDMGFWSWRLFIVGIFVAIVIRCTTMWHRERRGRKDIKPASSPEETLLVRPGSKSDTFYVRNKKVSMSLQRFWWENHWYSI